MELDDDFIARVQSLDVGSMSRNARILMLQPFWKNMS